MISRNDIINGLKVMGYDVDEYTTVKNRVEYEGIRFNRNGLCPVIYMDDSIRNSETLIEAIENVLCIYRNAKTFKFEQDKLLDPEFILDHLYIGLQKESQEKIVKAKTDFDGIEKYLYIKINDEAIAKLIDSQMKVLKIDEKKIWERAERNTFIRTKITSIAEKLSEITGTYVEEWEEIDDIPKLFTVGNDINSRGASAILDMGALKKFAEKIGIHRFFMLPSSIHEVIIIPDSGKIGKDELSTMVAEINQTQVIPEERLTDRSYVIEI